MRTERLCFFYSLAADWGNRSSDLLATDCTLKRQRWEERGLAWMLYGERKQLYTMALVMSQNMKQVTLRATRNARCPGRAQGRAAASQQLHFLPSG